ncbi:ABC transporter permease [Fibrisoma montanum]|uniref:ABC transporter permease n=1 Tax=Fibrisoma montanum TaxID=2305895 RepID=A0A418LVS7_9BACT|nr:ABC transporter permease [Fibrisoma montanum]RIV17347.1 ABC transporter permease [Fibrisoma montanum]
MLLNYLKIAVRSLWKNRVFSALNLVGMGIGIAAVGLMTLYIAHELSYDRFHANADRIVRVVHYASWPTGNLQIAPTSAPYAKALQTDYPDIEKTVRIHPEGGGMITYRDKTLEANDIYFADKTLFDIFSFPFLYGNPATALEQPQSIVLTKRLAENLFGDAAKAVGKPIAFSNNFINTVTGVIDDVPNNSHLRFSAIRSFPADYTSDWQNFELYTYLLLTKGTDHKALEAKLAGFYPKHLKKEVGELTYRMELQPLPSIHLHSHLDYEISPNGNAKTISVFVIIAALVLFIAGINYVNLYTARAITRTREVGVRKAIGSRRDQLVGQFLTESILMAFLASIIGVILMETALPWFNQLADRSLSVAQYGLFTPVVIVLVFTVLLGFGSGLYPALFLSGFRPVIALKGQVGSLTGKVRLRQSLVVFQFIIAIGLIAGSGVIFRQLNFMLTKELGFNKTQVLTFHLENEASRQQVRALKEELRKSPFIEQVAAASNPIGGNNIGTNGMFFEQNGTMPTATQIVQKFSVDPDYLSTLEIKLLKGRNFSESFPSDALGAVLVNEALVKKMGWQQPIGKRVRYFLGKDQVEEARVVGVVNDFHIYSLQHKIEPLVLQMPAPSEKDNLYVRIRPEKTKEALAAISQVYRKFDQASTPTFHFLDENFAQQYKTEEKQSQVLLAFTVLAIFIASLGLFGLAAFTAEQRTKEIGVRKVLGASVTSIVALLSEDFLKLVLIAILIASPLAWYAMHQWLNEFAYKIDLEWWMFALAGIQAVAIALLTVGFQSLKAALMNPVKSLRTE